MFDMEDKYQRHRLKAPTIADAKNMLLVVLNAKFIWT